MTGVDSTRCIGGNRRRGGRGSWRRSPCWSTACVLAVVGFGGGRLGRGRLCERPARRASSRRTGPWSRASVDGCDERDDRLFDLGCRRLARRRRSRRRGRAGRAASARSPRHRVGRAADRLRDAVLGAGSTSQFVVPRIVDASDDGRLVVPRRRSADLGRASCCRFGVGSAGARCTTGCSPLCRTLNGSSSRSSGAEPPGVSRRAADFAVLPPPTALFHHFDTVLPAPARGSRRGRRRARRASRRCCPRNRRCSMSSLVTSFAEPWGTLSSDRDVTPERQTRRPDVRCTCLSQSS